ncbi:hypothetical protein CHS0354_037356 [Potamilus streckersoni]|uniref:Uncharacterized protein n=1 Tax=Potamilus streckersoni TaxID=2493646 RepID=A0AAE0VP11_9BIVA|nr:hypothetical protein CHS0354_037356 [Potamilus streckersoni]
MAFSLVNIHRLHLRHDLNIPNLASITLGLRLFCDDCYIKKRDPDQVAATLVLIFQIFPYCSGHYSEMLTWSKLVGVCQAECLTPLNTLREKVYRNDVDWIEIAVTGSLKKSYWQQSHLPPFLGLLAVSICIR